MLLPAQRRRVELHAVMLGAVRQLGEATRRTERDQRCPIGFPVVGRRLEGETPRRVLHFDRGERAGMHLAENGCPQGMRRQGRRIASDCNIHGHARAVAWACRFDKQWRCAQFLGAAAHFRASVSEAPPAGGETGFILLI